MEKINGEIKILPRRHELYTCIYIYIFQGFRLCASSVHFYHGLCCNAKNDLCQVPRVPVHSGLGRVGIAVAFPSF